MKKTDLDLDAGTYQGKPFTRVETLTFDITVDDSYYGTIFDEVASSGSVMHCTLEHINVSDTFFLTLQGNKGEKCYYIQLAAIDYKFARTNELTFNTQSYYDGSQLIYDTNLKRDVITVRGSVNDTTITGVTLSLELDEMGELFLKIPSTNVSYTQLFPKDERSAFANRNLGILFGLTPKDTSDESEEEPEEQTQDPERSVKDMRGVYEDGARVIDFYVNYIAEIPLSVNPNQAPDWYQALGSNVKVVVVGLTQTRNGEDQFSYSMLRFTGDDGTQWFNMSSTEPNGNVSLGIAYNSILSVDGYTIIRNSVTYDTTDITFHLSGDDNYEIRSLTFHIGTQDITVDMEDINFIGGGSMSYEKLW